VTLPRKCLKKIGGHIRYYEVKEATMLVELALWKNMISHADEEVYPINRDACRVELPGPAKELILKYAYRILDASARYGVYIEFVGGVQIIIEVEPSDTIAYVKNKIHYKKVVPVDRQQLFFHGELLHDISIISECNIQMDSTIDLVVIGD